jgi:hypothetical protein
MQGYARTYQVMGLYGSWEQRNYQLCQSLDQVPVSVGGGSLVHDLRISNVVVSERMEIADIQIGFVPQIF